VPLPILPFVNDLGLFLGPFFLLLAYRRDSFFGIAIVILSYTGDGNKRVAALLSL
jgi:hypothetical protein